MKLIVCAVGSSFSSTWLTEWTRLVSGLTSAGHEVTARISNESLKTDDAALRWAFGEREKPFLAEGYDAAVILHHSVFPRLDDVTALLASPHGMTTAVFTNEPGTGLDSIVEWDDARLGQPDANFKAVTLPEKEPESDEERYVAVQACSLCMAVMTREAVEKVFRSEEGSSSGSAAPVDPFERAVEVKTTVPAPTEEDKDATREVVRRMRLEPSVAFLRRAVEAGVAPVCDVTVRAIRKTQGISRP